MIGPEKLPLWNNLSMHLYRTTLNRFGFNVNDVLFGELPINGCNKVVNVLILYSKQYILVVQNKTKNLTLLGYNIISYLNIN